jgi:hypothetical protein
MFQAAGLIQTRGAGPHCLVERPLRVAAED